MEMAVYRRRNPEGTVVYQVVREWLNTFLERADARAAEGRGLPKYVRNAFRRYLDCGILARGFVRVHCGECGYDGAVAFS